MLENIVWLKLRRRGYDVTIGKVGPTEVDFAARRQEDTIYIQVATTIAASAETRRREYAPLEAIADNHPKYVITLDPLAGDNTGGIQAPGPRRPPLASSPAGIQTRRPARQEDARQLLA